MNILSTNMVLISIYFYIDLYSDWKSSHIELNNLLCKLEENEIDKENDELCKLLIRMVFNSSKNTKENTERINVLLKNLYDKYYIDKK